MEKYRYDHINMITFAPPLLRAGLFGHSPLVLQGDEKGLFLGFVSVFLYFFISKPEVPNFDAVACKLGELHIQN